MTPRIWNSNSALAIAPPPWALSWPAPLNASRRPRPRSLASQVAHGVVMAGAPKYQLQKYLDGKLVAQATLAISSSTTTHATKTTVRLDPFYLYPAVFINRGTSQ